MKKIRRFRTKLHMGKRTKLFFTGTLCLALAVTLLYFVQGGGETLAAGGSITFEEEETEGLWGSYSDPSRKITKFTKLSLEQSLDISDFSVQVAGKELSPAQVEIIPEDQESGSTAASRTVTVALPIENLDSFSFQLENITPTVNYDRNEWGFEVNGNISDFNPNRAYVSQREELTFYKIVDDSAEGNCFEDFYEEVSSKYAEETDHAMTQSSHMLMTREERTAGRAYWNAINAVIEDYEATAYSEEQPIELTKGHRVDLITVSLVDFYFYLEGESSKWDYDVALFQTYSYQFEAVGVELAGPEPVLESGAALSDSADVSPDDCLIGLKAPEDMDEEKKGQYTTGELQYLLSAAEVTDLETAAWTTWTEGSEIPLDGNNYLYTRIIPKTEETYTGTVYLTGEPKKYSVDYLIEPSSTVTPEIQAGVVLESDNSYPGDTLTLSAEGSPALILYRMDGKPLVLEKVSYNQRETLNLDAKINSGQSGSYTDEDGNLYVRVNNLWYLCEKGVQMYDNENPVSVSYTDHVMELSVLALADGKLVDDTEAKTYKVQKLSAPEPQLESGISFQGSRAENVSGDDSLSFAGISAEQVTVQYYKSAEQITDFNSIEWETWSSETGVSAGGGPRLYVRMNSSNPSYVTSGIREYYLRYINDGTAGVTAGFSAGTAVTENYTDAVQLSTTESGGLIFYSLTYDQGEAFQKVNDGELRIQLNSRTNGTAAVSIEYNGNRYVRVNNLWYLCRTDVQYYEMPIEITKSQFEAGVQIYAWVLADGKTVDENADTITYTKLSPPDVSLESGYAISGPIPPGDCVTGMTVSEGTAAGKFQYYLSSRKMENVPSTYWTDWSEGASVELGQSAYLYVRTVPSDAAFMGSAVREYQLNYITKEPSSVSAKAYANGEIVSDGVDYNDEIELIELNVEADQQDALIFYTLNAGNPSFTKVSGTDRQKLDAQYTGSGPATILLDNIRYVKLNGLWYQCGAETCLYEERIQVDESIYQNNYLTVNAQALMEGCVISSPDRYSYSLTLREQVEAPTATPVGGSKIQMGSQVNLFCETTDSRIFYTVNGSSPVVNIRGDELILGDNTYEFTGDPIIITEDFAEYGSNVTVTAQASRFREYDGTLSRVMKDSPLVRFTYSVDAQSVVGAVTSVPATSDESRAEVQQGSRIHLYSSTDGAVIFYTLDGTEPVFDQATLEPANSSTVRYNASQGITVPEIGDSSLFTVTAVAYRTGLAVSDISRLIFRYPDAVSAPYATPSAGSVTEDTQVSLRTATDGAVIYYEIAYGDGTPDDPTEESSVFDSSNPFIITRKTTIKALAVKNGMKSAVSTFTYQVSEKLSTPEPEIASGSVVPSGTVIELSADEGATIYYTTDGSDPKKADNKNVLVGNSVIISGDAGTVVTVRTYASRSGYSDSEPGYYSYSISAYEGGIFSDKESGSTVKNGDVILLNTDVSNAVIYYTTDGSTPTTGSSQGNRVTVSGTPGENVIVMAIAVAEGTERSVSSATFTYTIMDKLAAPTASVPDGAVFTAEGQVALTAETGRIYYTTDGTDPTTASSLYRTPILIDESVTLKAITVADDYEQSDVSTYTYGFADQVATPVANYASGELEVGTTVTFSCETEGATIYYRTDGVDPDPSRVQELEVYTGPIAVSRAMTFKVIAVMDHMQDSRILTVGYTVREPEAVLEEEPEETQVITETSGRLQSRRSFSDTESGPSFSGIVLRNAVYGAVVSAEEEVLPENVQLQVERTQVTESVDNMVRQMISDNYGVVAGYDVTLLVDGEEVQPDGEIEIGLPIPVDYENSLIRVIHVQEDGSIEVFDTRRSGGVAYVVTDHLSVYAIAAPTDFQEQTGDFPWLPVIYTAAVVLIGTGVFLLYRSRKMKREGREQDE